MGSQAMTAAVSAAAGPLDEIERLGPTIAAASDRIEQERRLTPELLSDLHDAGLYRLLLPRAYGGGEVDPPTFFRAIAAIAQHDASTAWCLCQGNGCAMAAAYAPPAVANEIWGHDPHGVLAWGPGKAQVEREANGYRVTGSWSFASGMRHATWLGGHSPVPQPDGSTVVRTMLMPAHETKITDIWNVMGLRGTASDAFAVTDKFVPEAYSIVRDNQAELRVDGPLYHFPQTAMYSIGFSGTAQGIARGMLDAFKELAADKTPRKMSHALRDNAVVQSEVAQSEARLGAARAFMLSEISDIWDAVVASGELTVEQRMRIRLVTTFGIHEAKAVADMVYDAAGATAIFTSSAFERRFRDLHTVTQQIQGRKTNFQAVGSFMMGNTPDLSVI